MTSKATSETVLQAQKSDNIDPKLKKAPKLPVLEGLNWLIHLNYVKKDYKTCKDLIREQLVNTNGLCEYALYAQGLIMRQEGRIQESLDLFQNCAVLNPTNVQNLKQVARSLFLLGRHKAAVDVYTEALKLMPNDWEITHNLGICFVHLKNFDKAKAYFTEAINISKHELSFQMLAKIFVKENNIQAAIEILSKAVEYNSESCELLTLLGLLYMKEKEYQKAFEALGNALAYNPSHYKSILAICNMIQIHHDYDVALNKYRIAADHAPESPRLWNNIAMCFFGKKKYVAAISCLKRATYLSPFEWKILYNLGLIHLTMQQYASAFQYLSAAINLKPKESMVYSLLAVALTHLNDHSNAQNAYEHALGLDGDNVYTNLNYAVFLYNRGDRRGASTRLLTFRKNYDNLVQNQKRDIDQEMQAIAAKLGPILHLGESIVNKPAAPAPASTAATASDPVQSESSKKYQDLTANTNDYYREASMASVSNIAMAGATSRLSLNSARSTIPENATGREKDFEADF